MTLSTDILKNFIRGLSNLKWDNSNRSEVEGKVHDHHLKILANSIKSIHLADHRAFHSTFCKEKGESRSGSDLPFSPLIFRNQWKLETQNFPAHEYLHLCKKYHLKIHPIIATYLLLKHKEIENIASVLLLSDEKQRQFLMDNFPEYDLRIIDQWNSQPSKKTLSLWYLYYRITLSESEMNNKIIQLWKWLSNKQRGTLLEILSLQNIKSLPAQLFQEAPYSSQKLNIELATYEYLDQLSEGTTDLHQLKDELTGKEVNGNLSVQSLCQKYQCEVSELFKRILLNTRPSAIFSEDELVDLLKSPNKLAVEITANDLLYSVLKNDDHRALEIIIRQIRTSNQYHELFKRVSENNKINITAELFLKTSIPLLEQNTNKDLKIFIILSDLHTGFWPDRLSNLVLKRLKDQERFTTNAEDRDKLIQYLAARANPLLSKTLNLFLTEFPFSETNASLKKLVEAWEFRKEMRVAFDQIAKSENQTT